MHYRNGRVANNGDIIVQIGNEGRVEKFGVLHSATPGNDDLAALLKDAELDKRPVGK